MRIASSDRSTAGHGYACELGGDGIWLGSDLVDSEAALGTYPCDGEGSCTMGMVSGLVDWEAARGPRCSCLRPRDGERLCTVRKGSGLVGSEAASGRACRGQIGKSSLDANCDWYINTPK